jgi:hypothetical protein
MTSPKTHPLPHPLMTERITITIAGILAWIFFVHLAAHFLAAHLR